MARLVTAAMINPGWLIPEPRYEAGNKLRLRYLKSFLQATGMVVVLERNDAGYIGHTAFREKPEKRRVGYPVYKKEGGE